MHSSTNLKIASSSIREQAYEKLLELILNGTLPPGARLDLTQLSHDMGVSRTPVKEAIQRLIENGMIEVKPRSGTFVSTIDPERTVQNFWFRLALEIGTADEIIAKVERHSISQLRDLNDEMRRLATEASVDEMIEDFLKSDAKFHNTIIDLTGNAIISERYRQTGVLLQMMRLKRHHTRDSYMQVTVEHSAILSALERRDVEGLRHACRHHVEAATKRFSTSSVI